VAAAAGDPAVFDAVRGLVWPARRKARSALPGAHVAVTRGSSAEFVEYRPYRQGDDPRKIDWKLLGRTDRVYVRLSPDRAVLPTMLVLDASASMGFPAGTLRKWTAASALALGLAAIARHGGDPVGLAVATGAGLQVVTPRTRRSVLDEMARVVAPPPEGSAALAPAVEVALRRAARVVILSDFLGDADAQLALARRFAAAGREIHAVHVIAREELEPEPGRRRVADPEQPALRRPMPPSAREAYLRAFGAWRSELGRAWLGAGAGYTVVIPDAEPLRQTIRRIIALPAGAGGGR
jgi:uncharacterized protein (DUF58 family)